MALHHARPPLFPLARSLRVVANNNNNNNQRAACSLLHPPTATFKSQAAVKDDDEEEGEKGKEAVGVIGLGNMGAAMAHNFLASGYRVTVYDLQAKLMDKLVAKGATPAKSIDDLGNKVKTIVTMLPNDEVVMRVAGEAHQNLGHVLGPGQLHVNCSTISPCTARHVSTLHQSRGAKYVGAPVFARPDGIATKKAYFVVGGQPQDIRRATPLLLSTGSQVFDFGEDPGAGNVVKLCGNFLIATTIESMGEALALAEANHLDRDKVMRMLTSTIFDCLIYKGYGARVAHRDHRPGGFSLDLGLKDLALVHQVARDTQVPMPLASTLHDRLLAAKRRGRGQLDWSALALSASEESGVDITEAIHRSTTP